MAGVLNRAGLSSGTINTFSHYCNDNFAMNRTKNIPSCCDNNNIASTLESKEWLSNPRTLEMTQLIECLCVKC